MDLAGVITATAQLEACDDGSALELAEACRWRAQALVAQGNTSAALEAFALLATFSPDYVLDPLLSPKLHELFQAGRSRALDEQRVFARLLRPLQVAGGTLVRAEVYDAPARQLTVSFQFREVQVPARQSGSHQHEALAPAGMAGLFRAQVKHLDQVVFVTPNGRLAATDAPYVGSTSLSPAPSTTEALAESLRQPEVDSRSRLRTGLLIAGGAALVVGAVIAAVAITSRQPLNGSLGRIDLP